MWYTTIKDSSDGASSNTIIRKIKEIDSHLNAVDFQFVRRDGNLVENYLAKTCISTDFEVQVIVSPSAFVKQLLLDDNTVIHDV